MQMGTESPGLSSLGFSFALLERMGEMPVFGGFLGRRKENGKSFEKSQKMCYNILIKDLNKFQGIVK